MTELLLTERHHMTKYDIATAFWDCKHEYDQFIESLPSSIEQAFYENEAYVAQEQLAHKLLKAMLSESEYDDLCYFAYESNPRVEIDGYTFTSLEDYWAYCDSLEG